ncbi:glycogen debranching protein GlgX [Propionibacteriaceae bacterium Y1923]|uniref:glycogen debranching protein GlgX n=1 Tax=Aestuariimicrobium sp. Y1814 TaxID=3418742 RepID=UPI003C1B80D7
MSHPPVDAHRAPLDSKILGARLMDGGCRFALWAPRATRVELALVNADRTQQNIDMTRNPDGVWVVFVPGVEAEQRYGYRVHGEWEPDQGMRFNPAKLLLDPYARAITAGVDYSGPISDHVEGQNFELDPRDSFAAVPLSVVVADTPPPTPLAERPSASRKVIYETHVKGYTQQHPDVPEHLRGTYAGMAYPAVIEHLKQVGVTSLQLLPVHHFVSEPFVVGKGLVNYWGYNTLGFFAPHAAYCSVGTMGEQVTEFKNMVSAMHEAGIEVFLDVVYNHTGEGGHEGPTLAYRGIDHAGYYRLTQDLRNDYDVTGTGNSVDTSNPGVLQLIIDSLEYWVTQMGVDGFRFDLATTLVRDRNHHVDMNHEFMKVIESNPVFEGITMIAEPWDVGPYGYQVGSWGPRWGEWNDRYRGFVRDFWRGATHGVQELATRLAGSPDIFDHVGRRTDASVNFVTAHDGFTMRDVVTYDMKHNEANGEQNRDGSDDNRSWNHGWEGETTDPRINALRHQQVKNMLATLLLSYGTPMLTAGDEMGRTQGGNNNAYCQDSPISWVHWETREDWGDVLDLTMALTELRRDNPVLRRSHYRYHDEVLDANGRPTGRIDLTWMSGNGGQMGEQDWTDPGRHHLGMYVSNQAAAFLIWFHNGPDPVSVQLPVEERWGEGFELLLDTAEGVRETPQTHDLGDVIELPGRSVTVMRVVLLEPATEVGDEESHRLDGSDEPDTVEQEPAVDEVAEDAAVPGPGITQFPPD